MSESEKVYCVMQIEDYENVCLSAVFKKEENAKQYIEMQEKLYPESTFYYIEKEFKDNSFKYEKVVAYYNYLIDLDEPFNEEEADEFNACWGKESQVYTYDNYVQLNETDNIIDAYSTESLEKAKEIALDVYNKYVNKKEIKNSYYNVFQIKKSDVSKYLPYDTKTCPICGGKIKHPYTGNVTNEQLEEDMNTCLLMEVIDENDITLGYTAICRNNN